MKTSNFYLLCQTAKFYGSRPSAMLGIGDDYVSYCLDEAGAWLLSQPEPPKYGREKGERPQKKLNDPQVLERLIRAGGAKMIK